MIKFATLICAGFVVFGTASAQTPGYVRQSAEWTGANVVVGLTKKIGINNDANFRFVGKFQDQQNQLRSGIEYTFNKHFSIVPIGYSYIWNPIYGKQPASFVNNEFRFWQQAQYKHRVGRIAFSHRLRLEQRNIARHHTNEAGAVVADGYINDQGRLRYRLNATLPLKTTPEATHYYYLNMYDEAFYSWGHYVKFRTPSQNRLFAGVGYQFSKSVSLQAGFLYQWLKKDNGMSTENNIGGLVQFNYAFAMFKRAK